MWGFSSLRVRQDDEEILVSLSQSAVSVTERFWASLPPNCPLGRQVTERFWASLPPNCTP